ncbi:hypothetical protein TRIUR3_11208 [Triticum urartu]|uniref:Uncharacterized protein n=1 Tax=Triticum urartu TaxID=4572 RepID=M8A484_TRIUA|nr:hypothetical protein TRIUR3_11208 [Triticum urartu]
MDEATLRPGCPCPEKQPKTKLGVHHLQFQHRRRQEQPRPRLQEGYAVGTPPLSALSWETSSCVRVRGEADAGEEMASEDVVGKSRGDTAINTIVNLAEEAKLAREGVKGPGHQVLTVCKSLFAGGVARGL